MTSLRGALRKLRIDRGDVILCKDPRLIERVANCGLESAQGTPIIFVENFDDLRTLSEESMNKLGWYRRKSP